MDDPPTLSFEQAETLKVNTAPRRNMANLNPKRTKRCNQSSLVETLKGTTPRHRPTWYAAFGEISKRTTPRHRPSMYAAFGEISKRTTPRHRPSMYAAFGEISKRTTSRHRRSMYGLLQCMFAWYRSVCEKHTSDICVPILSIVD